MFEWFTRLEFLKTALNSKFCIFLYKIEIHTSWIIFIKQILWSLMKWKGVENLSDTYLILCQNFSSFGCIETKLLDAEVSICVFITRNNLCGLWCDQYNKNC